MTITELAIKRPTLVVVLFTFLGVLGVFGFFQLQIELMPKMTLPIITVRTIYPGASPNEIQTSVTKIIEDAVSGIDKVKNVRSSSIEGMSMVVIEMLQDANIDFAVQDAQRKVNGVEMMLPTDIKKPVVSKIAFDELPVLRMSCYSNLSPKEFYQFIIDKIQPRFSKLDGVGQVLILGGEEREIQINIDPDRLQSYGLSLIQIVGAVRASNMEIPTGKVKEDEDQFTVRIAGKLKSVDDLKNLIVFRSKQGGDVKLSDVADIEDGFREIDNINRLNGVSSVGIQVQKQNDANVVSVSRAVKKEIEKMEKQMSGMNLKFVIASDGSEYTMASIHAVEEDLLFAILLVALVMMIFLHSFRNSLIVMVAIPASLVSTFFMMYIFNFTLNTMTLLAMSLIIGILVDDSIVVLENIYRHLEMGDKPKDAALKGRNEIGFAALSITLVDVVVFLPLALISGVIGSMIRQYSLVVVFSTLMSLAVSFTITPMLASRFTKLEHLAKNSLMGRFGLWFERFYSRITGFYNKILKWSLANGGKVVITAFLLFLSSFMLPMLGFLGNEFMPVSDQGEFVVTLECDPGSSFENTNFMTQRAELMISKIPGVIRVTSSVGASGEGLVGQYSNNSSQITVKVIEKNKRTKSLDDIGIEVKKKLQTIPGIKVRVDAVSIFGSSNQAPVQFVISGTDYDSVYVTAKLMENIAKSVQGATDVRLSTELSKPELRVDIDRKKMAQFGLSISDVGNNLRVALTGDDNSKFRDGINEYIIRVRLDEFERNNLETVRNFTIMNTKGQPVQLKQFANIYQSIGPTKLERMNRMATINLFSQVYGKTSGVLAKEILAKIKTVKLPPGIEVKITGQQEYMAESFQSLFMALFAAILFVYMIMVALYNSFLYPFIVLFSIPVAIVGALYALALTGKSISIFSIMGIIMLVGLVAKNAILLVDRTNQMKLERGLTTYEAILEAGQTRLRPILMTTFAMIFGMMPIALSTSAGSETKSGLAICIIGGLTTSLFLTLVVVPVVYQRFDKWKLSMVKLKNRILKKNTEILIEES